jgi:membrane protease YdiL (CAAX protease family)
MMTVFINPDTHILRGGWRLAIFLALVVVPQFASFIYSETPQIVQGNEVPVSASTIIFYFVAITWALFISWICLHFVDQLDLSSLGFFPHRGCSRDIVFGFGLSFMMISLVVLIQSLAGGTTINIARAPALEASYEVLGALLLFGLAASFEEILFRGYPLQTLLRSLPSAAAVVIAALLFAIAHSNNPSPTMLSTVNTFFAGIWLGVAYLKTRSLWFPSGLHIGWNWTMGALYGLPVSGLHVPARPLLSAESAEPIWLTGGVYGPEGGVAATLVLLCGTLVISQLPLRSSR